MSVKLDEKVIEKDISELFDFAKLLKEYEEIIGSDLDTSIGFACLRTEEGDSGAISIFLKGELLGQVQKQVGVYCALVKRNGQILKKKYEKEGSAMVSVIVMNADKIAQELVNSGKKGIVEERTKELEAEIGLKG